MRIISLNANGIRSAGSKGVFEWLRAQNADVVCLQETKAQEGQLTDAMFRPDGHHCFFRDASSCEGLRFFHSHQPELIHLVDH